MQTAFGKESQKTKSSAIYCRHSDPKRTDMRNDAMCNVQQYKWTFETSSSTQHLSDMDPEGAHICPRSRWR